MNRWGGRPVTRFPGQLRLHPALDELGWIGVADEFNEAAGLTNQSLPVPILITTNGTILAGIGKWRSAVFDGQQELNCIEYSLSHEEALKFILAHHGIRRGWNPYVRICLALTLEVSFQEKARDNMRAGGKHKGLANLPKAEHINVRDEIARAAGVGTRNVSNVKKIHEIAHPRLKEALRDGTLSISRAIQLCKFPRAEQLEQFIRCSEERATNKVIRQCIDRPKREKTRSDAVAALTALLQQETREPGSVAVRVGRRKRTLVVLGQDLIDGPYSQKELPLT
jgi:hypothetical protein